jgi:hypothetical protein
MLSERKRGGVQEKTQKRGKLGQHKATIYIRSRIQSRIYCRMLSSIQSNHVVRNPKLPNEYVIQISPYYLCYPYLSTEYPYLQVMYLSCLSRFAFHFPNLARSSYNKPKILCVLMLSSQNLVKQNQSIPKPFAMQPALAPAPLNVRD